LQSRLSLLQPAGACDEKIVAGNAKASFALWTSAGVQKVRREEKLVVSRSAIDRERKAGVVKAMVWRERRRSWRGGVSNRERG